MNSYFLYRAPCPTWYPHVGHWGQPWEVPLITCILSPNCTLYKLIIGSTHTGLWRKKFEICKVLALGALPLGPPIGATCTIWITLNHRPLEDDSCHVWLQSNHAFFKKKMKQLLFTKGPQGPIGATLGTAMNNFCSSSNKVSTHYMTGLFSFWIWRRQMSEFVCFWPFGAPPLGPHGGHTYYLNNFESPTPNDNSCNFCKNPTMHFQKEDETVTLYKGPTGAHWGHIEYCHEQPLFFI